MSDTTTAQCLKICNTLINRGLSFSFSLNIGSNFSFSLETREMTQKKTTPSQNRRNEKRRQKFLESRNLQPAPSIPPNPTVEDTSEKLVTEQDNIKEFKCDQCDHIAVSRCTLSVHIRRKHKIPQIDGTTDSPDKVKCVPQNCDTHPPPHPLPPSPSSLPLNLPPSHLLPPSPPSPVRRVMINGPLQVSCIQALQRIEEKGYYNENGEKEDLKLYVEVYTMCSPSNP